MSDQEAALPKVVVLGHDEEAVGCRTVPDRPVIGSLQSEVADMARSRKAIGNVTHETRRQVLIEQELHRHGKDTTPGRVADQAAGSVTRRRSRSAAKA